MTIQYSHVEYRFLASSLSLLGTTSTQDQQLSTDNDLNEHREVVRAEETVEPDSSPPYFLL